MSNFVRWHEGMFPGPHHLRAGEAVVHDRVERGETWHASHPCGLAECEPDLDGLVDGVLRVPRVRARFRDGTHLLAPGKASPDPLPVPRRRSPAGPR